eukprot:Nk52_evm32s215 gene=Nk52_evmTU32s215
MGREFEYDTSGMTSYLFVMSVLTLYLVPATLSYVGAYLNPEIELDDDPSFLTIDEDQSSSPILKKRFSGVEYTYEEYDPYSILGLDQGASQAQVRKQYRELSKIYHPDKNQGDAEAEAKFVDIAKAHATLTDPVTKKNWEEFGHPDGKQAITFGIALPSWIVDENYRYLVLACYCLVFLVAMPICVGIWWSHSKKYAADQVLMSTSYLYYTFVTPNMSVKKVIALLGASAEFNEELPLKKSDNEDIPNIQKLLPEKFEKTKFTHPYCIKAKTLLHAHINRIEDMSAQALEDKAFIVKKSQKLLQAILNMAFHKRCLNTAIHCMEVNQMIVQAMWDVHSPLLQLPYVTPGMLRHFVSKKKNIRSMYDLMMVDEEDRRSLLRNMTDREYDLAIQVLNKYPMVDLNYTCKVMDEDKVTAGSTVTVKVNLKRISGMENIRKAREGSLSSKSDSFEYLDKSLLNEDANSPDIKVRKVRKGNKVIVKRVSVSKNGREETSETLLDEKDDAVCAADDLGANSVETSDTEDDKKKVVEYVEDDDAEWERLQADIKRKKILEDLKIATHKVYSPYFPVSKTESWWVFVGDAKSNLVLTPIQRVDDLEETKSLDLHFVAPPKEGHYTFIIFLMSDSYFGADQKQTLKIHVHKAEPIEELPPLSDSESSDEDDDDVSLDSGAQLEKENDVDFDSE